MASIQDPGTRNHIPMVEEINQKGANKWRALDVDLDLVARIKGTDGTGRKQRLHHKREQRSYEQRLRGKQHENSLQ